MSVPTATLPALCLRLRATAQSAAILRTALKAWLDENGVSAGEIFDLVVACAEPLTIAIEGPSRPVALIVEVAGKIEGEMLTVAVRDYGLCRLEPQEPEETLGMSLMAALVDTVSVQTHRDGRTFTLSHRLRGQRGRDGFVSSRPA